LILPSGSLALQLVAVPTFYVAHPVKAMGKSSKKNEKKGKSRKDKKAKKQSSSSSSSAEVAEDPEDRKNTLAVASSFGVIPGFPNWP